MDSPLLVFIGTRLQGRLTVLVRTCQQIPLSPAWVLQNCQSWACTSYMPAKRCAYDIFMCTAYRACLITSMEVMLIKSTSSYLVEIICWSNCFKWDSSPMRARPMRQKRHRVGPNQHCKADAPVSASLQRLAHPTNTAPTNTLVSWPCSMT